MSFKTNFNYSNFFSAYPLVFHTNFLSAYPRGFHTTTRINSPFDSNDGDSDNDSYPKVGEKGKDGKYSDSDISVARQFSRERGRRVSPSQLRTKIDSNGDDKYYVKGDSTDSDGTSRAPSQSSSEGKYPWDSREDASPKQESPRDNDESKDPSATATAAPIEANTLKRSTSEAEDPNRANKRFKQDSTDVTSDTDMPDYGWDGGGD